MHCVVFKSEMLKFHDSTNLKYEVSTLEPDKRHFLKSTTTTGVGIIFKTMA